MQEISERLRPYHLHVLLFILCFVAYVSNQDFLPGNDQKGNMLLAVNILKKQSLSFEAKDAPENFWWEIDRPDGKSGQITIQEWGRELEDLEQQGHLQHRPKYFLTKTARPNRYVNTFGIGTAMTILPFYAALDLFVDITRDRFWLWHFGAVVAALFTALSAVLIFATARRFVSPLPAFLVAVAFGLGSCVWPISSQALYQHSASILYLCLGAYLLFGISRRPALAAWCGAVFGMAVLCRPQNALVVVSVGVYLLWVNRRWAVAYVLGGLPFAAILFAYNAYYFDNPLAFGQVLSSAKLAITKTGSETLWHVRWWESLPGLFASPHRGLIWYSPVLLFGVYGAVLAWKNPPYHPLIPLQVSVLLLILVAASWYDWWGGLTWGYRPILDATPYMALAIIPVIERIWSSQKLRIAFVASLAWSIAVQFVGAYAFIGWHWQQRLLAEDISEQEDIWQWRRPQIIEHLVNFGSERESKQMVQDNYTRDKRMPFFYVHPTKDNP